ncbi:MAG: 2-hydroxyacid dehydrogenase [Granulosicoccus sp.]
MKVLLTKKLLAEDREYLRERIDSGIDIVEPVSWDEQGVIASMVGVDVLLGGLLTEVIYQSARDVNFFQIPWTGIDNLDFDLIQKYDVTVCNSHSSARVVAEHAVALMLASARKIPYHDRLLRAGKWNRVNAGGNAVTPFSRNIFGSRVLLLGFGGIGQAIARMLAGFSCRINVVNSTGEKPDLDIEIDTVYPTSQLALAVENADWVFVVMPLTETTNNLVDTAVFESMKAECTLINVSRGAIVDESALFAALSTKSIAGAAIDTWYTYPSVSSPESAPSSNFNFAKLDNIVMSPHRAGYATGGFPHLDDVAKNLNRAKAGKPLINRISATKGY